MKDKITAKEFLYIGIISIAPGLLLIKGLYMYSGIAYILALCLVFFDPVFKKAMKVVVDIRIFVYCSLLTGLLVGVIAYFIPNASIPGGAIWLIGLTIYAFKLGSIIDKS